LIAGPGAALSSLSSIVSYGLSSLIVGPALSSLSSIVSYGLSTMARQPNPGLSSLSSIVSYGLSTVAQQPNSGLSSLSSIVSYGLSTFAVALSTFSTSISQSFTTSSLFVNGISSTYGSFSTLSTGNILIGYVGAPLQVDTGVVTPVLTTSNIVTSYGYIVNNFGIGKLAPFWYALDVSGASRLPTISSVFVQASSFSGNGGGLVNVPNAGVSSLSSVVSYGLSSLIQSSGISSLSSIISYGLSSIGGLVSPGISSLSSIIAYGLSSVITNQILINGQTFIYSDSTDTTIFNGKPFAGYQVQDQFFKVAMLANTSVTSYAYNTSNLWVAASPTTPLGLYYSLDGVHWLQGNFPNYNSYNNKTGYYPTFVNYIAAANMWVTAGKNINTTQYVAYSYDGITWSNSALSGFSNVNDITYGNNMWIITGQLGGNYTIAATSNIINGPLLTSNIGFGQTGLHVAYNNSLFVTVGFDGFFHNIKYSTNNGTTWVNASNTTLGNNNFLFPANIVLYDNYSGWIVAGQQFSNNGLSIYQSTDGSNFRAIQTQDISNIAQFLDITSTKTGTFYAKVQTSNGYYIAASSNGCSNWSYITSYTPSGPIGQPCYGKGIQVGFINTSFMTQDIYSPTIVTSNLYVTCNAIINNNLTVLSTIYTQYIVGDGSGLSNIGFGTSSLSSILSYGLSSLYSPSGVSSLSSIVSYGLSSLGVGISNLGSALSSLSFIVSYGLSSIAQQAGSSPGVSSLSSIVSYGLSSLTNVIGSNNPASGISSLSTIVSYGLSSLAGETINPVVFSLSSIISYGLSSIYDDHLHYDPYTPPGFHISTIGGTGIRDASTGSPDTYTGALGLIDYWLYKNIVDQPPVPAPIATPITNAIFTSISSLQVNWSNIFQFKIGLINAYVPLISSLTVNVYSNTPSVINPSSNLLSSFLYGSNYIPYGVSNFTGFELNSGIPPGITPGYSFTQSNPLSPNPLSLTNTILKVYIPPSILRQVNDPYSIDVYFANYSSNAYNILHFSNINLTYINPPSAPIPVFLSNMTISNAFVYIGKPLSNSTTPPGDFPTIVSYQVYLSNDGTIPRRYGISPPGPSLCNTYTLPFSSNPQPQSNFLANLAADSHFFVSVAAINQQNPNYGPYTISAVNTTLLPVAPGTLTNIYSDTSTNPPFFTQNGQVAFNATCNTLNVYNRNNLSNGGLYFYTNTNLGVLTSNNSGGSANQSYASINITTNYGGTQRESNTLGLRAFGVTIPYSSSNIGASSYTTIIASNISDPYANDPIQCNFYLAFTGRALLSNSYLVGASNYYTFSITHSNVGYNTNLQYASNIWVDDLAAGPGVSAFSNTSNTSNLYISGVPVYSYSNLIQFNIDTTNFARFFFITGQNAYNLTFYLGGTAISGALTCNVSNAAYYDSNNNQITSAPLNSSLTRFKLSYLFNNATNYTIANGSGYVSGTIRLSNLCNVAGIAPQCNVGIYFDGPSQILQQVSLSNQYAPGGQRFESDSGSNNAVPSILYVTSNLIASNSSVPNYNFELPLVGGFFKTGANLSNAYNTITTYLNPTGAIVTFPSLSNYSNIQNETGTRFATFKYTLSNGGGVGAYVPIIFLRVNGLSGIGASSAPYPPAVNYFQYRINNTGSYNTGWLNANSVRSGITTYSNNASNLPGLYSNVGSYTITSNSRYISIIPIAPGCNFDIYVKIGLQMNSNINFSYISVSNIYNALPPLVTRAVLSNDALCNIYLSWVTPANCNSPLDYYAFNIYACNSDPVYPRRYVPNATPTNLVIQETTLLGNTCNNLWTIPNTTSFSYKNGYSNYDTYYYGNILLANNVGQGAQSNFALVGVRTPLPPILSPAFSNASNFVPGSGASYLPYSNGFNFSYRVYNIQIYASGGTATLDSMNPGISNVFNVNSNPGAGLSNSFLTATWSQGGAVAATATYQFSNTLWQYSNVPTSGGVSSGAMTLNIYNIQDQSPSGTLTGFFMKAYANILMTPWGAGSNSNVFNITLGGVVPQQSISTRQIYIENAPSGSASIISIQPDVSQYGSIVSYSNYICGVLTMLTTTIHPFFIGASNIGSYFFASNPVVVGLWSNPVGGGTLLSNFPFVNGGGSSTPFYGAQSVGSVYSVAPISNATFFLWSNGISYPQYTPSNSASFTGTACNLSYAAAAVASFVYGSNSSSGQQNFFYDTYSWTILNATLNSNWSVAGPNYGARVESGAGSNPDITGGGFGTVFNNCNSLLTTYSNELQLSYGAYRTYCNATFNGASNGYLDYTNYFNPLTGGVYNYSNYSGIGPASGSNFRYLTLKYSFSGSGSSASNWTSADIGFIFGDAPFYFDSVNQLFPGISVYYRIVASNDGGASNTNYTTTWLNANSNTIFAPDSNTKNIYGTPTGILVSGAGADSSNLRVYLPTLNYSNINYNFYIRIGIPMNSNVSLKYVYLIPLIQSFKPQALSNLTLSNAQTLPLTNTTMSWYRQNDGVSITNFYLKYGATACNVGGVTYPRRYLNNVISDLGSSNSNIGPNTGVPNYFTWLFTPSNYDTYYWGTVFASNVSGISPPPLLSNTSINRTPLPSNIGSDFGSGLQLTVTSVIFPNSGVGLSFANRGGGLIVVPILNYNNGNFYSGVGMYSNGARITNLTANPTLTNVGNGLSNVTFTFTTTGPGCNLSYTFNYCNSYFASNGATSILITASNQQYTLSNITDMYSLDNYRSNFYLTVNPFIAFSNFPTSSNIYQFTLSDVTRVKSNFLQFYVDQNQQVVPSGNIKVQNNLGDIAYTYICGIPVITSSNFKFWIQTSNIGGYFFNSNAVSATLSNNGTAITSNFIFNSLKTPFYYYSNTASNYSVGPISNYTYFYWSNVGVTNAYAAYFTLGATLSNLLGGANISGTFNPYFDPASIALVNSNIRVESGGGAANPAVGTFGALFNNTILLTNGAYNTELFTVNGAYVTPKTGGYSNFNNVDFFIPNGATANNYNSYVSSNYMYVAFLFSNIVTTNTSNKIDTITFSLNYTSGVTQPTLTGGDSGTYTNNTFQIRFNSNVAATSNDTSGWLNANSSNGLNPITIFAKSNDGTAALTSNIFRNGYTDILTIKVPDGCGYSNISNTLYTRVGANNPNNYSFSLTTINYTSYTEVNIPSQFYYSSTIVGFNFNVFLNVPYGLPTYIYNTLSNLLYFSNTDGSYSLSNTCNYAMSPLLNNYQLVSEPTGFVGTYSNYTSIYLPNGSLFWDSKYTFTLTGTAPLLSDFTVVNNSNGTFFANITPTLNTPINVTTPVTFWWKVTDNNGGGPNAVGPSSYQGPISSGSTGTINNDICTWGHNFTFNIFASNSVGISPTSNIPAISGNQLTVNDSITNGISLIDNNTGIVTVTATLNAPNPPNPSSGYTFDWNVGIANSNPWSTGYGSGANINVTSPSPINFFDFFNKYIGIRHQISGGQPSCYGIATPNYDTQGPTADYTIATPNLNIEFTNVTNSNFLVTVTATNLPVAPTGVTLTTIWTVTAGGVESIYSNTNNQYQFYGNQENTNYIVTAQYSMNDGLTTKMSDIGDISSTSPTFAPSYFISSDNPLNSDSVTQASFPANAISNTCLIVFNSYNDSQYFYYTTSSGGTEVDPIITPGDTASLQGYSGQGLSTTYNYSYYYR
jgi:hypothetical protein